MRYQWQSCDEHYGEVAMFIPETVLPQVCRECRVRAIRRAHELRRALNGEEIYTNSSANSFDSKPLTMDALLTTMREVKRKLEAERRWP